MGFRLIEIPRLSGNRCQILSVVPDGEADSLLERFLKENEEKYPAEIREIYTRLKVIGHEEGAREGYFKLKEGSPGDLVCALYDCPDAHLRLYCIRFGTVAVILGGGGLKTVRSWQDDRVLAQHAREMIEVSKRIYKAIQDKKLRVTDAGLKGDWVFEDNDDSTDDYE